MGGKKRGFWENFGRKKMEKLELDKDSRLIYQELKNGEGVRRFLRNCL